MLRAGHVDLYANRANKIGLYMPQGVAAKQHTRFLPVGTLWGTPRCLSGANETRFLHVLCTMERRLLRMGLIPQRCHAGILPIDWPGVTSAYERHIKTTILHISTITRPLHWPRAVSVPRTRDPICTCQLQPTGGLTQVGLFSCSPGIPHRGVIFSLEGAAAGHFRRAYREEGQLWLAHKSNGGTQSSCYTGPRDPWHHHVGYSGKENR